MEYGQYKQVYKISVDSVSGLDQVKSMIDNNFIESNLRRFQEMNADFSKAYKAIPNQ